MAKQMSERVGAMPGSVLVVLRDGTLIESAVARSRAAGQVLRERGQWWLSGSSEEIDDFLDSGVGTVIGVFQFACRLMVSQRAMVEAAVGQGAAEPLVEEEEEEGDLDAFGGETIGVA